MRTLIMLIVLALGMAAGCSTYHAPAIRHGASYGTVFAGGHSLDLPDLQVRASAVGFVDLGGHSSLRVAVSMGATGLQFSEPADSARLAVRLRLRGPTDTALADTLTLPRGAFRPNFTYAARLPVATGSYKVKVDLADLASGTHGSRVAHAVVPVPGPPENTSELGSVRAEAKDSASWRPLAGYSLAGRPDSLRFTLRVAPDSAGAPLVVRARLLRFRADSSIAGSFYLKAADTSSSLVWRGIDYSDSTILHASRRTLTGGGVVQIRFRYKAPSRGNYRFVAHAGERGKGRDFGVKSRNFPAVKTPYERAAPLAYLMDPKNYLDLMGIANPDSLAAATAHFWQAHIGNSANARKVASKYYKRVRAANRLFSNYKAGWKTDRGRLYILLGPPSRVFNPCISCGSLDGKTIASWRYPGPRGFQLSVFIEPKSQSKKFPFEHFILPKELLGYVSRQRQWWLSGKILHNNLPP